MTTLRRLQSLEIRGFRTFSHLHVPRLAQVNLLVGKNGVGKTSFLEAVAMYASGEHAISRVSRLLEDREEIARGSDETEDRFPQWSLDRIFHDSGNGLTKSFSIGPAKHERATLTVAQGGIRYLVSSDGASRTREILDEFDDSSALDTESTPALIVKVGNVVERAIQLDRITRLDGRFIAARRHDESRLTSGQFLPAKGFQRDETGELWDNIVLTDREDDVVAALRVIDSSIVRLSMIEHPRARRGERIALVKRNDARAPESLKSLGDGMNRLFELALAMVNCANGFFLVDEIENGIHHSVQVSLWSFVTALAARLNIQVFATTHSLDCIRAFQRATCSDGSDCLLVRLQRTEQAIEVDLFESDDLAVIALEDVEVR